VHLGLDTFVFFKGVLRKPVGLAELLPSTRCFERGEGQTTKTLYEGEENARLEGIRKQKQKRTK